MSATIVNEHVHLQIILSRTAIALPAKLQENETAKSARNFRSS
jgi:hypothetical protein